MKTKNRFYFLPLSFLYSLELVLWMLFKRTWFFLNIIYTKQNYFVLRFIYKLRRILYSIYGYYLNLVYNVYVKCTEVVY